MFSSTCQDIGAAHSGLFGHVSAAARHVTPTEAHDHRLTHSGKDFSWLCNVVHAYSLYVLVV